MKNEMCQKPSKKNNCKKITKPNKFGSSISQNKQRQPSKQKGITYYIQIFVIIIHFFVYKI